MKTKRISVRQARASISKILREGSVVTIGDHHTLRGFIVPIPPPHPPEPEPSPRGTQERQGRVHRRVDRRTARIRRHGVHASDRQRVHTSTPKAPRSPSHPLGANLAGAKRLARHRFARLAKAHGRSRAAWGVFARAGPPPHPPVAPARAAKIKSAGLRPGLPPPPGLARLPPRRACRSRGRGLRPLPVAGAPSPRPVAPTRPAEADSQRRQEQSHREGGKKPKHRPTPVRAAPAPPRRKRTPRKTGRCATRTEPNRAGRWTAPGPGNPKSRNGPPRAGPT
jgi:hypothetical protein